MKKLVIAALTLTILGGTAAEARHHGRQVCVTHHHHRACHWR